MEKNIFPELQIIDEKQQPNRFELKKDEIEKIKFMIEKNYENVLMQVRKSIPDSIKSVETIGEVFHTIQNQPNATLFDPNYRKQITKEIEHRLDQIAYWKYLPIPE